MKISRVDVEDNLSEYILSHVGAGTRKIDSVLGLNRH